MKFTYLLLLIIPAFVFATDDAERNPTAKKIKAKITSKLSKSSHQNGYCDVYLYMRHSGTKAYIKSIKTSGDYKLCKQTRKAVPLKKGFKYKQPEKIIRLHISMLDE